LNIPGAAAADRTHKNELMLFYTLLELSLINVGLDLGVISPKVFTMNRRIVLRAGRF
jgi:hypothetical protein